MANKKFLNGFLVKKGENMKNVDLEKMADDIAKIKNDLNIVKANTQINANLLSLLHSNDIIDIIFKSANNEKLCCTLLVCKEPKTAKELCEVLSVKPSNIRKQIIDKLVAASLLTIADKKGQSERYQRAAYLDIVGFDNKVIQKYPTLKGVLG